MSMGGDVVFVLSVMDLTCAFTADKRPVVKNVEAFTFQFAVDKGLLAVVDLVRAATAAGEINVKNATAHKSVFTIVELISARTVEDLLFADIIACVKAAGTARVKGVVALKFACIAAENLSAGSALDHIFVPIIAVSANALTVGGRPHACISVAGVIVETVEARRYVRMVGRNNTA